ncbi:hypothetical protein R2R70_16355 [Cobetia sp. SIMBA_158]|uniref:hypothetical protein n=1 Tax=Cobetia sp. SIMBA_158 TaxID=3081617 RepID=UPI0039816FA5
MTQVARMRDGSLVYANTIPINEWEILKKSADSDGFIMPCCDASAILKTSINGAQFFAHTAGECSSAPETKWHKTGKATVMAALASLGVESCDEVKGRRMQALSATPY